MKHFSIPLPLLFFIARTLQHGLVPDQPDYNCFEKDPAPVNIDEEFLDYCKDYAGNIHYEFANLTSCCECIRYECVPLVEWNRHKYYYWNMSVSEHCCLHCDGTVYKADTVIETVVEKDECGTTKTSVCRKNDGGIADIEVDFTYKYCCNDEEGILPIDTIKLEPSTCSNRTCEYSRSSQHSSWISTQVLPGCNCCVLDGELVSDGYSWEVDGVEYECCDGKIVTVVEGSGGPPVIEGIFIAGSYSSSKEGYEALYIPSSNSFCEIPAVQPEREYPIRFEWTVCLGIDRKGCSVYDIDTGIWNEYWGCLSTKHNTGVAWVTDIGVFIMGGLNFTDGVTLLLSDGACQELDDFGLQPSFEHACAVPDDDTETVIIIPFNIENEVISRYNKDGFVEHISSPPSPLAGGCSYYRQDDGTMVLLMANKTTTATLVIGENNWTVYNGIAPKAYPSNLASSDNIVYSALGGYRDNTEIERWDYDLKQWVTVYNAGYSVFDKIGMLATTVNLDSETCPIY